jgi:Tat protein translocase TatB subunit
MNLGPAEILVICVVALLVFGPARLPEVGRQVGGALRELRRMQASVRAELDEALREPSPAPPAPPANTTPAVDEGDHPEPPAEPPADAPEADDRFAGPRDSFI